MNKNILMAINAAVVIGCVTYASNTIAPAIIGKLNENETDIKQMLLNTGGVIAGAIAIGVLTMTIIDIETQNQDLIKMVGDLVEKVNNLA